jgi:hypothetical protein
MLKDLPSSSIWIAAVVAVFGTYVFVSGVQSVYRNWQFAGAVERTMGTVTNRYTTVTQGRRGPRTYYHISYHYRDTQDAQFFAGAGVTSQTYSSLTESDPVPIKYLHLPNSQELSRVDLPAEDRKHEWDAWSYVVLGCAFGGLGASVFITLAQRIFHQYGLPKNGVNYVGQLDHIDTGAVTVNQSQVRYRSTVTPTRDAGSSGTAAGH